MPVESFMADLNTAASRLRDYGQDEVTVVFHDDADGICSGACLKWALEDLGYSVKLFSLERLLVQVIEKLHSDSGGVYIYADIASPHANLISKHNGGRNLVIILDHHDPVEAADPMVLNVNPEFHGFEGEEDASGATVSYLFAEKLNEKTRDLAYLALIGSAELPVGYRGLNEPILKQALSSGVVDRRMRIARLGVTVKQVFRVLQVIGPVGFFDGGPAKGVKLVLEGWDENLRKEAEELSARRKKVNRTMLAALYRTGLNEGKSIQWFDSGDVFEGMGTKVVGTFCSMLSHHRRLVNPANYLMGFMRIPNEIPDFGELEGDFWKVSSRVPPALRVLIKARKRRPINSILTKAAKACGELADGHAYAASAAVPSGLRDKFIELADMEAGRAANLTGLVA